MEDQVGGDGQGNGQEGKVDDILSFVGDRALGPRLGLSDCGCEGEQECGEFREESAEVHDGLS